MACQQRLELRPEILRNAGPTVEFVASTKFKVCVPVAHRAAVQASRRSGLPVFLEIQKARGLLLERVEQVLGASMRSKALRGLDRSMAHDQRDEVGPLSATAATDATGSARSARTFALNRACDGAHTSN